MSSIVKQGIMLRRLRYMNYHFISDELNSPRELWDMMNSLMPATHVTKMLSNGRRMSGTQVIRKIFPYKIRLKSIKRLWVMHPNGNDNKNDKSDTEKREERIQELQTLRQRNIDHDLEQQSVWKALKERDEIMGKRSSDSDKKEEKEDDNK